MIKQITLMGKIRLQKEAEKIKNSERPVGNVGYRIVVDFGCDYCIGSYF